MKREKSTQSKVSKFAVMLLAVVCVAGVATSGQERPGPAGLPEDWSHRHVIFSNPGTYAQMLEAGVPQEKWLNWVEVQKDPRFLLHLKKKLKDEKEAQDQVQMALAGGITTKQANGATADGAPGQNKKKPPVTGEEIHRDWSNVMGGASGTGDTRTYPAKFTFSTDTKSCATDFVVFTTSTAGATSSGAVNTRTGTFSGVPAAGGTVTITNVPYTPDQVLTLTADASVNTGLKFAVGASATEAASNLANAIARNGGTVGATATSAGAVVTLNSITTAVPNANLTAAETLTNFGPWGAQTAGTGAAGQPTIFALNQLYADTVANGGCQTSTQAVPATYWSYNTGTGAIADLSPVISFYDNGAQVAFVQKSASVASLVLLKWSSTVSVGTIGQPTAPTSVAAAAYRGCTAPCMTVLTFNGSPNDTNSAPFMDYGNDTIYVGDDAGKVHKFTNVFVSGTPTEAGSPWPVQVAGTPPTAVVSFLSSPVFDFVSGLVFVGSNGPNATTGNKLHSINSSGTVVSAGTMGSASTVNGVRDSPIVDVTAQKVYAFEGDDARNSGTDAAGASCANCNAVYQFATTFSGGNQGSRVFVGLSGANNDLNRTMSGGAFDDAYYSSGGSSGSLYVCGSASVNDRRATLWKITISGGSFATATEGPLLVATDANDGCSPTTIFKNGSNEYLFASVSVAGTATGGSACTAAGCMYMYNLSNLEATNVFDTTSTKSKINDANDRFMSVSTSTGLSTTESTVQTTLTADQAGTYQGMTITQGANTGASTTYFYTLRKQTSPNPAADTVITCQIATGAATCSDTTNTVAFAAGDKIDVRVSRTGTAQLDTTFRVQLGAKLWSSATPVTAALNATGGTGGIIIDNSLGGGGSQIYFSTRASPGIAVQTTQAGLQ